MMSGDHMLEVSLGSPSNKGYIPTDDELLQRFLFNKVHRKPLPTSINVLEYDLYGGVKNPWEIWEEFRDSHSYGGKDIYFFTTLKKKSATSSRLVRTIGLGSWEGEDTGKIVFAKDTNQPLGLKKRFRFEKSDTYHDGGWILHEYSLHVSLINDSMGKDIVLCRFRKNILRRKDLRNTSQTKQRKTLMVIEQVDETKTCNDVLLRENAYQEPMNQPRGEDHKVIEISESENKKEEDGVRNTRQRITIVLGVAAATKSDNNDACSGNFFYQESAKPNDEEQKTELIETPIKEECECNKEDVNNMPWFECFANELKVLNGEKFIKEEDIQLDPNEFNKELLLERIDSNLVSTS